MLAARRLVKRFHGSAAVADVSFELRAGEVVGYLGPNGSGKSTTGRMLTGLLAPSSGEVFFNGSNIATDAVAFRRRLGYVPEEPHLYTFQSAAEYLALVGRLREIPEAARETKTRALLELFGLSHAADQDLGTFSRGMKQKVMIVAALLHDPDLVILDEPDSGLDVTATLVLRHLITALAARGKAVLYSSHVLDLVEKTCERVIVIHRGRIVADDRVDSLRVLMRSGSLEEVFSQLALQTDPVQTASDIADIVTGHA